MRTSEFASLMGVYEKRTMLVERVAPDRLLSRKKLQLRVVWSGTFLASFTLNHLSQSDLIPAALSLVSSIRLGLHRTSSFEYVSLITIGSKESEPLNQIIKVTISSSSLSQATVCIQCSISVPLISSQAIQPIHERLAFY